MKTNHQLKRSGRKRPLPNAKKRDRKTFPKPICQHRRGPFEFSCGFDDPRALLVEESLDERERRG